MPRSRSQSAHAPARRATSGRTLAILTTLGLLLSLLLPPSAVRRAPVQEPLAGNNPGGNLEAQHRPSGFRARSKGHSATVGRPATAHAASTRPRKETRAARPGLTSPYTAGGSASPSPRDARSEALLKELGRGFAIHYTPHFRIAYDGSRDLARYHGRLFEAVYSAFTQFFTASGFELDIPQDRLDVIVFDTRDAFRRYAVTNKHPADSAGFYTIGRNRSVFYNAFDDPQYRQQRDHLNTQGEMLQELQKTIRKSRGQEVTLTFSDGRRQILARESALRVVHEKKRSLEAGRQKLRQHYEQRDASTTIHECAHQLAFNMGIHSPRSDTPTWLAEGIATFFETVGWAEDSSNGLLNPQRFRSFQRARSTHTLIPLSRLIVDDKYFRTGSSTSLTAYGQSWGLVHYLIQRKPRKFFEYVRAVASGRNSGSEDRTSHRARQFRRAFGQDISVVERDWRSFMERLES